MPFDPRVPRPIGPRLPAGHASWMFVLKGRTARTSPLSLFALATQPRLTKGQRNVTRLCATIFLTKKIRLHNWLFISEIRKFSHPAGLFRGFWDLKDPEHTGSWLGPEFLNQRVRGEILYYVFMSTSNFLLLCKGMSVALYFHTYIVGLSVCLLLLPSPPPSPPLSFSSLSPQGYLPVPVVSLAF